MHQDIAFRTAYLLTGSAADAEDAAQAGFVKAWTALPRFRRGSPFKPWLLRIVANVARTKGVRETRSVPFSALGEDGPSVPEERFRAQSADS